jgi:hypothetical protein
MDRDACRKILAEIEEQIVAKESPLGWKIGRELADYTVAFVISKDGELRPAGTGTLVSFRGGHYFLTAAHVWEAVLRQCDAIRIPLKENTRWRFAISPREIVPYSTELPGSWGEWGPDMALLRIPPERVGSFTAAGRPFYPLSVKRELLLDCATETWFLMGAPALRGKFTSESAIPELQAMNVITGTRSFAPIALQAELRAQFDFLDIAVDTTQPDVAADFGGVSGGGLWRVYAFKGTDGEIRTFKVLDGLAFWQKSIDSGLLIRCHGPQSIGALLCRLYD